MYHINQISTEILYKRQNGTKEQNVFMIPGTTNLSDCSVFRNTTVIKDMTRYIRCSNINC